MSNWPGNLIRKTPVIPAGPFQNSAASGVWSLAEASYWTKQGLWPTQGVLPNVLLNGASISSGTYIYNNSNTVNTLTVTGRPVSVTFRAWGAAGGNGSYGSGNSSGAGGYARGTVTLQPGTTYYIYVGQGGFGPSDTDGIGGLGGWPNGGFGTRGDASGAGGGGMTMLSKAIFSTGMSDSDILLIAGAGGGSTGYAGFAGAGGGTDGQNAAAGPATGGSQAAGGTYNGAKLTGGNATGSRTSGLDDGGGGGGGYYGGGGGTSDAQPGAGGSGYFNTVFTSSVTLTTGSGATAPNPESLLPGGYASGKTDILGTPQNGNPGIVYLTF
jgi:hypothetical protein